MRQRLAWLIVLLVLAGCGPGPAAIPVPSPTVAPAESVAGTAVVTAQPTASQSQDVHHAEGAGQWYPADPAKLQAMVDAYLSEAGDVPLPGPLMAVIVPHAGYVYSGAVAGYAFRAMQQAGCTDRTVVVIGDSHTGNGSAPIAVWAVGAFETPLGSIPVDEAVAQALVTVDGPIRFDPAAFEGEHPVENQLPFVQTVCPGARLIPVVFREPTLDNAERLARALVAALGGRQALIVASTDLSHYHPYDEARIIDSVALQAITSMDPQAVLDSPRRCSSLGIAGEPLTMCSQGAVMAALIAAKLLGASQATVLDYATSGDVPLGDRSQVVGYGAVALFQGPAAPSQADQAQEVGLGLSSTPVANSTTQPVPLSADAKRALLELARHTAKQFLASETFPSFRTDDPALLQSLGAFVTYRRQEELRGCVGRLDADRPVYLNVQYAAVAAALADSRFPPITPEELAGLTLEVTVLHPLRPIAGPTEIELGRDGILLEVGGEGRSVFLPQVPEEQGWTLDETLVNLCRKAGLVDDCWKGTDAHLSVFTGEWFGEGD